MKTKFFSAMIVAAMLIPAAAQARQPNIYDRDRGVMVKDHRDTRQTHHQRGDRYNPQRQDWRQDQRYHNFRAPFAYQRFQTGSKLKPNYYGRNYRQTWDSRWGLPRANKNQSYVRHYNDLLLVNDRNGKVMRVYRDHFRRR
ncbi:MAG TPA: RcnB family protein [Sphingopyxis sp.]|nr:RcnB family protein [Sphingopyxis sp.]